MEETKKMTKLDKFKAVLDFLGEVDAPADFIDFLDGEVERLENRNARDAEKRAEKAKEKSEIDENMFSLLTNEPQTATEIVMAYAEKFGMVEGLSDGKVVQAMKKFADEIEKTKVKGRTAYKLA